MTKNQQQGWAEARVVYVRKENARTVKNRLKESRFLDDRFRMIPAAASGSDGNTAVAVAAVRDDASAYIAIPVCDEFDEETLCSNDDKNNNNNNNDEKESGLSNSMIVGVGYQRCPYSTKMLGNGRVNHREITITGHAGTTAAHAEKFTLLQSVILGTSPTTTTGLDKPSLALDPAIVHRVLQLDSTVCPASKRRQALEIFGDDRTVVVPPGAFEGEEFVSILRDVHRLHNCNSTGDVDSAHSTASPEDTINLYTDFWRRLAAAHGSPRVVRRGGIDPNSKIRESGHRVLWPPPTAADGSNSTTPHSHSWIRVTEQGIKQSFDLSKVMFSRGNISEKIRFGKHLVREGDVVLDMYAGIGYYTLPAVIHGKAAKVYACEWNEHAVTALRFNVRDNQIEDRVQILVGDSRKSIETHKILGRVDRVSLGLLPSSQGGWRSAIRALKVSCGGWLHIHANVPALELESWTLWVCHTLSLLARDEGKPDQWWILCDHVERVKSFAPTVFHYVADVFVGIPSQASYPRGQEFIQEASRAAKSPDMHAGSRESTCRAWMRQRSTQTWIPAHEETVVTPSCALSAEGVLSQDWMR